MQARCGGTIIARGCKQDAPPCRDTAAPALCVWVALGVLGASRGVGAVLTGVASPLLSPPLRAGYGGRAPFGQGRCPRSPGSLWGAVSVPLGSRGGPFGEPCGVRSSCWWGWGAVRWHSSAWRLPGGGSVEFFCQKPRRGERREGKGRLKPYVTEMRVMESVGARRPQRGSCRS